MLPTGKIHELIAPLKSQIQNHTLDTRGLGGTDASGALDWCLAFDLMQIVADRTVRVDVRNPQRTLAQLSAHGNTPFRTPAATHKITRLDELLPWR